MRDSVPWSVSLHRGRAWGMLGLLIVLAVMLELAAGVGLAALAGFHHVRHVVRVLAFWLPLPVSLAALPTLRMMSAPARKPADSKR